jgi:hypothetical protein
MGMTLEDYAADLLAIGEPTHGEPAFPQLRNHLFAELTGRGFRSIALETDRAAALVADAFVQGEEVPWADGFTHGFGALPANRDLLFWMRDYNAGRPPAERLTFHGFDGPMEISGAPDAGPYLARVAAFLGVPRVEPAELFLALHAAAPGRDPRAWQAAEVDAGTALGLLRYHALAAEPLPPAEMMSAQLGVRAAIMAGNLLAIRAAEAHRGRTLAFAHNRHLQRHRSRIATGGTTLEWTGTGSILAALLGERYRVVAGSLGASPALGIAEAEGDSFEGRLRLLRAYGVVPAAEVPRGEVRSAPPIYFPLDAETVDHAHAVLHVPSGVDPAVLTERILALPGVEHQEAGGDLFFFVGAERMRPFATIVHHDVPGFDEASQLDRAGVFRLNVDLGRRDFERRFGFAPRELPTHLGDYDFARTDEVFPHPSYGTAAWGSIVSPGPWRLAEVDELLAHAHQRR